MSALPAAEFSPDRRYRYVLRRRCTPQLRHPAKELVVIGLNPSTADETTDDPTVRRLVRFASEWGFAGIILLNLFAFRATSPDDMLRADDPEGPENDLYIPRYATGSDVLCAWGAHGAHRRRGEQVLSGLRYMGTSRLWCLGLCRNGEPKHPLYLPANTPRVPL